MPLDRLAAVDDQGVPDDEGGRVQAQPDDGRGNLPPILGVAAPGRPSYAQAHIRRYDSARWTAADRTSRPALSSHALSGSPRRSPRTDDRTSMRRASFRRAAGDG